MNAAFVRCQLTRQAIRWKAQYGPELFLLNVLPVLSSGRAKWQEPFNSRRQARRAKGRTPEVIAVRAEGVITRAHEVDIGSIFGWGFAPQTGGVISFVETMEGIDTFIVNADQLAANVGDRYKIPGMLREMAAEGKSFYA